MIHFQVHDEFICVLFTASLIAAQYFLTQMVVDGPRKRAFTQEFLKENFGEEHERCFPGQALPKHGYPDTGNGRYGEKLGYKEWFDLATAQRIHYNYLEAIGSILTWIVISGIAYPWISIGCGISYFIGRLVYLFGYMKLGPNGRFIGVLIIFLASLTSFVTSVLTPFKMKGLI